MSSAGNNSPAPPARRLWLWLGGLTLAFALPLGLLVGGVAWTVRNTVRAGASTVALRDALCAASEDAWQPQVQGRAVGPLLAAVRLAARCASVPPEARLALDAVRSADVAVLQLRPGHAVPAPAGMLAQARAAAEPGWAPTVTVVDGEDLVAVFLRDDAGDGSEAIACRVVVMADGHLVIGSAELSAEALVRLVEKVADEHGWPENIPGLALVPRAW